MARETVANRRYTDEFKLEALRLAEAFGQKPLGVVGQFPRAR